MNEPLTEKEKLRRDPSTKLWTVEVVFYSPEPDQEALIKKKEWNNLMHYEFRELRASLFAEGVLYAVDPRRFVVAPPGNIKTVYASLQKKYIE